MGFSFNGISSQSMGIATRQTRENRMPDFTNNTITVPGREGVFDFGETIGERKIEISCFLPPGKPDAEFLARKDAIIAWLNPDLGLRPLILDKEPGRVYQARLESGFSFDKMVRNSCTFDLVFLCPDPYAYAGEDETFTITEAGTHTIHRSLGNADSLPVYSVTAELAKGKSAVVETNGIRLSVNGVLSEKEILVIDASLMTAKVTDLAGNTLRNGLPHLQSLDFPTLKPGENTIRIEAESSTTKAVKSLDTQDAFTGQIPSAWGKDGSWRMNDTAPDADACLADGSGKNRKMYVNNWSGTTAALRQDGHLGGYLVMNTNNPASEQTYLKVSNDGSLFSSLGSALAVGGWFRPTTYSVGNTFCPILNTRCGPGQPLFYLSLYNGKPRLMLYNASGTLIYDQSFTPSFSLKNGEWYFIACILRPERKTASYFLGCRSTGEAWSTDITFTGELNRSCTADLVWGMHADSYWYAGAFDDWFLDCDSSLTAEELTAWFQKSLSANGAGATSDVDGLSTSDVVTLKKTSGAYPASGILTTAAVEYGIDGTCYVSAEADLPESTDISVETSTSDDLTEWSDWTAPDSNGKILSDSAAYIRFRVTLSTTDTSVTPTLQSITLSTSGTSAFKRLTIQAKSRWR